MHDRRRVLVRAGFLLFLLALLTGFAVPAFPNPRMGMAAHVTGVVNALVLVVLGLAWNLVSLPQKLGSWTIGLFLYGTYANWAGCGLAAAWGASRLTPIAGAGFTAAPWQEAVVQGILVSLSVAMMAGTGVVLYGLRPRSGNETS